MNLTFNLPNSAVNLVLEKGQEAMVLAEYGKSWGAEAAKQAALSKAYTVKEAAVRMRVSPQTVMRLINDNKIRYKCAGTSRGYSISEQAIREFYGDVQSES